MDEDKKKKMMKLIRWIGAIIAGSIITAVAVKYNLDQNSVESVRTVVIKLIQDEEVTDAETSKAVGGGIVIVTDIIQQETAKDKKEELPVKKTP